MIKQTRFSDKIKFFFKDFCERWNLTGYRYKTKPAFFAGVYDAADVRAINSHKGFKVIWHTGRIRPAMREVKNENCVLMLNKGIEITYPAGFKIKRTAIELKDYSDFQPCPPGEKVYVYLGNNRVRDDYGYREVQEIKKRIDFEVIEAYLGHPMSEVMEWYGDSFINLKFRQIGGFGTSVEMAKMGRPSIGNTDMAYCMKWNDIDEMIRIINEMFYNPPDLGDLTDGVFTTGDEWKEEEFWTKNIEIT